MSMKSLLIGALVICFLVAAIEEQGLVNAKRSKRPKTTRTPPPPTTYSSTGSSSATLNDLEAATNQTQTADILSTTTESSTPMSRTTPKTTSDTKEDKQSITPAPSTTKKGAPNSDMKPKERGTTDKPLDEQKTTTTTQAVAAQTSTIAVAVTVVGLLLLVIILILLIVVIWSTAVSCRKIKNLSRQNNVQALDNPTYNGTSLETECTTNSPIDPASNAQELVYHVLEAPSSNQGHTHHEYEIVTDFTEDEASIEGSCHQGPTLTQRIYSASNSRVEEHHVHHKYENVSLDTATPSKMSVTEDTAREPLPDNQISPGDDYSTLDDSVHDYAILEPHFSGSFSSSLKTQTISSDSQLDDYAHLTHH